MIAAFGNLQIRIVLRRQADALRRNKIGEGIVRLGQIPMHRMHDFVSSVGAGHGQHLRVGGQDHAVLCTQTASHDNLAVFVQCFADGVERLFHGGIDEAAGIDHDEISVVIRTGNLITFSPQPGQDVFGIYRCLGTAE